MPKLQDIKKVLVIGSGPIIIGQAAEFDYAGTQACLALKEEGYDVILLCHKSLHQARELSTIIRELGRNAAAYDVDLRDPIEIKKAATNIIRMVGTPDVIVNNAGVWHGGVIQDMKTAKIEEMFNVNIKAMIHICKEFVPSMVERKSGSIINISSMWGQSGSSCESVYSATKGAVDAFTKSLAKELGPSGIRVNAVAPGVILTDMCKYYSEDDLRVLAEDTPLQRNGQPEDVANAVTFLVSEKASFITGQIIGVNGGILI